MYLEGAYFLNRMFLCLLLFLFHLPSDTFAWESEKTSVVFLIDCSGSMVTNDPKREVLSSVSGMIEYFPSDYEVGFVGFSSDIVLEVPLMSFSHDIEFDFLKKELQSIQYNGYTNAGLGLSTAVELLRDVEGEKHIILVSDGEILLPSQNGTVESQVLFRDTALESEDVSLHILALGDWGASISESFLFLESQPMNPTLYFRDNSVTKSFFQIYREEIQENIKETEIFVDESQEVIVPTTITDRFLLFVQSSEVIIDFSSDYDGKWDEKYISQNNHTQIIEFKNLNEEYLTFSVKTDSPTIIQYATYSEISVFPKVELLTSEKIAKISFYSVNEPNLQVFTEDFYDDSVITILEGEKVTKLALKDGFLTYSLETAENFSLSFDFSDFSETVLSCPDLFFGLEQVVMEVPVEKERNYFLLLPVVFTVVIFGMIFQKQQEKNKLPKELLVTSTRKQVFSGKKNKNTHFYVGLLKLELSRGKEDFPVTSYSLFRVPEHRPVSLEEILSVCYDIPSIQGSEQIVFSPWKDKYLALTNGSDGTLLYKHEILRKNQRHTLPVGAKIDLLLEDGSELVIIYDLP